MKRAAEEDSLSEDEKERRESYKTEREKRRQKTWEEALRATHFRSLHRKNNELDYLKKERLVLLERYITFTPRTAKQQEYFDDLQENAKDIDETRAKEMKLDLTEPMPDNWTENGFPSSSDDSEL